MMYDFAEWASVSLYCWLCWLLLLLVVKVLEGHVGPVSSVAISVDGSKIVSGGGNKYPYPGDDKTVRVWSMETGEVRH